MALNSGEASDKTDYCSIFISYQWKSQPKIKKLYSELASYNYLDVFMDIYRIKAGHNLYASLATNIQQADVVLACVSSEYVKSKNCEREIIYADQFNKSILPLYIEKMQIQDLGSIGFILVRERYCNLYKNENIFDNLKGSDELNDIIDGITSVINNKKLNIQLPLKKGQDMVFEEPNFDQAIQRFRDDTPLEQLFVTKKPEKEEEDNDDDNFVESNNRSNKEQSHRGGNIVSVPSAPRKPILLPSKKPPKKKTPEAPAPTKPKPTSGSRSFNFFQLHPIIKELKFLLSPKVLLDPLGDRFEFSGADVCRGGEIYHKPIGWIRYGLRISQIYPNLTEWMGNDGNPGEWCVVYHSFKTDPVKAGAYRKLFDKNKFSPNFRLSQNLSFVNDRDVNPNSESYNSSCGMGIFCSARPDVAETVTAKFILNGVKYKMLIQCRADPVKVRIPEKNKELRIIGSMDYLRPYGLLIKEVE